MIVKTKTTKTTTGRPIERKDDGDDFLSHRKDVAA
jgi:hypothetical protein